jgi:hypothetical protein
LFSSKTCFSSKTRTAWHLDLDGVGYQFEVEHSLVTGKKRFFKNGCFVFEEPSIRKPLMIDFNIGKHVLKIT